MLWLLSPPPAERVFTVEETAQIITLSLPTVSKCCAGSITRRLNFLTNTHTHAHSERERKKWERERARVWMTSQSFFLKEQYLGGTFPSLAPASWLSHLKSIARGKCFCNLFDHIKIGSRFVCCDNVCWATGSQSVSHSGPAGCVRALKTRRVPACANNVLFYLGPGTVKESVLARLRKTLCTQTFPPHLPPH